MNEQFKKRMIGAVVLVALVVIFVPMLLDGGDKKGMSSFGSNVPDRPDNTFQTIEIPLQLPAQPENVQQRVVESEQQAAAYEALNSAPASPSAPAPATEAPAPAPAPAAASPVQPAPRAPAPVAATARPQAAGAQAWVVQLGSFGKAANAMALRDKARAKGFTAFVEQVKVDGGTLAYRVRIGPELKRENADTLKAKAAEALGVSAVVMGHP